MHMLHRYEMLYYYYYYSNRSKIQSALSIHHRQLQRKLEYQR